MNDQQNIFQYFSIKIIEIIDPTLYTCEFYIMMRE